jgi:hypothetical protein
MPCQNKPAHGRRISHPIDLFAWVDRRAALISSATRLGTQRDAI